MDIAKYIGFYLLKNNFCYIHGLGNLELKKKPATYTDGALNAPTYEITLSPTGSIDDNLANFIATNEQISISKAANALRDFTANARQELQAGNDVVIPAIGRFVEEDGKIHFITDPKLQYTPPSVPTIKNAPRIAEAAKQSTSTYEKPNFEYAPRTEFQETKPVNWGKIILLIIVIAVVLGAIIFGMNYMKTTTVATEDMEATQQPTEDVVSTAPLVPDSILNAEPEAPTENTSPAIVEKGGQLSFRVVVNEYPDSARAQKRMRDLISYGNTIEMVQDANGQYLLLMPLTVPAADTAKELNRLKANYNPNGVYIYRP